MRNSQGVPFIKGVCTICQKPCPADDYYHNFCAEKQFQENLRLRRNKRRVNKEYSNKL